MLEYCNFGFFHENDLFANSVNRHICDVKNLGIVHALPKSVNARVFSSFREDFNFTKLRINIKFPNLQCRPPQNPFQLY